MSLFTTTNNFFKVFVMMGMLPPRNFRMRRLYHFYGYSVLIVFLVLFLMSYITSFFYEDFTDILERDFFLWTSGASFLPSLLWLSIFRTTGLWELHDFVNSEMFTKHENPRHKELIVYYGRQAEIAAKTFGTVVVVFCLLFITHPFLKDDRSGVFTGWFPFDRKQSPFYESVYVWHSVVVSYIGIIEFGFSLIYVCLMLVATCQLNILCDKLKNIPYDVVKKEDNEGMEADSVYKELVNCVELHVYILRYIKKYMEVFDVVITIHLAPLVVYVLQSMYQIIMGTREFAQILLGFVVLSGALCDTLIYCWFAENVTEQSSLLNEAIVLSKWTKADKKVRQALSIILANVQVPISINAGGIVTMGMPTFLGIVKAGYSVFAIFKK